MTSKKVLSLVLLGCIVLIIVGGILFIGEVNKPAEEKSVIKEDKLLIDQYAEYSSSMAKGESTKNSATNGLTISAILYACIALAGIIGVVVIVHENFLNKNDN